MIIKAESETLDDRYSGQGWQKTWWWRRGKIDTESADIWHRGETMGTTKEMRDDKRDR